MLGGEEGGRMVTNVGRGLWRRMWVEVCGDEERGCESHSRRAWRSSERALTCVEALSRKLEQ